MVKFKKKKKRQTQKANENCLQKIHLSVWGKLRMNSAWCLSLLEYLAFSTFPSILKASKLWEKDVSMKYTKSDIYTFDCLMEEENY